MILTTPFPVLRTLDYSRAGFDDLKKTAITQLGAGRNAKLQLQFTSRYWNTSGPWGLSNGDSYTDLGYQNTWDVTRAQPGATGIINNYSGGNVAGAFAPSVPYSNASTNKQVTTYAKAFLKELEIVFPGITRALERQGDVVDAVSRPEPVLLILVLARRPVHLVQRVRGRRTRADPFRRRALLDRLPGLHGRRGGEGGRAALEVFHALTGK